MDNPITDHYAEATTIGMKILGAVAAVLTFRWLTNIFRGPDRKLSQREFKSLVALIFFVGAGAWIIWKEGQRTDLTHEVYGMGYLSIVFGSLLVVLHLESALDKILAILQALVALRRGGVVNTPQINTQVSVTTGKEASDSSEGN